MGLALTASGPCVCAVDWEDLLSHDFHGLTIQPRLEVGEAYTDNLTYAKGTNQLADLQSTFSPGLRLRLGDQTGNYLRGEYTHDEIVLLDNSQDNYRQERLGARGIFDSGRLKLAANESFERLSGFLGGLVGQSGSVNSAPRQRDVSSGNLRASYDWTGRTDVYTEFNHYQTYWAKDVGLYSYNTMRGSLGGGFKATERINVFTEAFYGQSGVRAAQTNQTPGVASAFYGTFIGARGDFTARFSGSAKVGVEDRSYFEVPSKSILIPAFDLDLRYELSAYTAAQLQYARRTSPSINFGGQNQTADTVTALVTRQLGASGRWSLQGLGSFQMSDYNNSASVQFSNARTDNFISTTLTLRYQPRPWLTASGGYGFEHYSVSFANPLLARFNTTGYQANRVFVNLSLGF